MMLKKLLFLGFLGLAVVAYGFTGQYDECRVAGTSTNAGGNFYHYVDSSDTHKVDTFYSDTVDIGDYKWVMVIAQVTGFVLADSANDSVPVMFKVYGTYAGAGKQTLINDSLNATAGALDSTLEFTWIIRTDTVPVSKLYFETVISDSFIAGETEDDNDDSSRFAIRYQVVQTGSR